MSPRGGSRRMDANSDTTRHGLPTTPGPLAPLRGATANLVPQVHRGSGFWERPNSYVLLTELVPSLNHFVWALYGLVLIMRRLQLT